MSATFNIFFKIIGVLGGEAEAAGATYAPYQVTTTNDTLDERYVPVADGGYVNVYDPLNTGVGTTADFVALVLIPTVSGILSWYTGSDNSTSSCGLAANVPFILTKATTTEAGASARLRVDATEQAIDEVLFKNTSGGAGFLKIFGIS